MSENTKIFSTEKSENTEIFLAKKSENTEIFFAKKSENTEILATDVKYMASQKCKCEIQLSLPNFAFVVFCN